MGKTALLDQYVDGNFNPYSTVTIGQMFSTKTLKVDGSNVTVHIWDTGDLITTLWQFLIFFSYHIRIVVYYMYVCSLPKCMIEQCVYNFFSAGQERFQAVAPM